MTKNPPQAPAGGAPPAWYPQGPGAQPTTLVGPAAPGPWMGSALEPPAGPPPGWGPVPQPRPPVNGQPGPGTAPMAMAPRGPSFPPAPRPEPRPGGRHRTGTSSMTWAVLAAVTAILLVAVAIVLWRNGVLPTAAGTEETATSADAGTSGGTTTDGTTDGTTTDQGATPTDGTVVPPPLPGGATDGTTDGTTTDGTTTDGTTTGGTTTGTTGDLGLAVPISQPACDGSFVVFLGSVTDPTQYQAAVGALLAQYPGSSYLLTAGSCTSLRQAYTDGSQIYAVYTGPYLSQDEACAARASSGDAAAYVKVLDNTTPPEQIVSC